MWRIVISHPLSTSTPGWCIVFDPILSSRNSRSFNWASWGSRQDRVGHKVVREYFARGSGSRGASSACGVDNMGFHFAQGQESETGAATSDHRDHSMTSEPLSVHGATAVATPDSHVRTLSYSQQIKKNESTNQRLVQKLELDSIILS